MGLFSDNLDYKGLDALCISVNRTIECTNIDIPLYVEARISYVTFYNAKEVKIGEVTVKELKKSGDLAYAIKPIFEKYVSEEVNLHPEYSEKIFQNDLGELIYNEKNAINLIGSRLFKAALTKIWNPNGFDEVNFEKVYGIAPVGFKIWDIQCGLPLPCDISKLLNTSSVSIADEDSGIEVFATPEAEVASDPIIESETHEDTSEILSLQEEISTIEAKFTEKQLEIQSVRDNLKKTISSANSLEEQLRKVEALIAIYGNEQAIYQKYIDEVENGVKYIKELKLENEKKQTILEDLKSRSAHEIIPQSENDELLTSIIEHISFHL